MVPPPSSGASITIIVAASAAAFVLTAAWVHRRRVDREGAAKNSSPAPAPASEACDDDPDVRAAVVDRGDEKREANVLISERSLPLDNAADDDGLIHKEIAITSASDAPEGNDNDDDDGGEGRGGRRILSKGTVTVAYCSTTGTCAGFAERLHRELSGRLDVNGDGRDGRAQLIRVSDVDWWDELVNDEEGEDGGNGNGNFNGAARGGPPVLLFVLPTWTNGTLPPDSETLLESLREITTDWRVAPEPLRSADPSRQLRVGAFGMGSSAYDASTVGKPAREVFAALVGKMGARPLVTKTAGSGREGRKAKSLMVGDSEAGDSDAVFDKWMDGIVASVLQGLGGSGKNSNVIAGRGKNKAGANKRKQKPEQQQQEQKSEEGGEESGCACKSPGGDNDAKDAGCCKSSGDEKAKGDSAGCCSDKNEGEDENSMTDSLSNEGEEEDYDYDSEDDDDSEGDDIVDVEDMGDVMKSQSSAAKSKEPQEMVTPKQAKALKKEGYKLIGTHSAVKLCRWTKHQLRGRGGCYKHTHYGITSYQCMEATPSLACANKCVFCWRHHKNPVGKEWRWKTDDPLMIVEQAVLAHVDMIKETKGIPGIRMDRWKEGHRVRHCALSLVGEPIMYPKINELLGELHRREISTFLVTNGQHPAAIDALIPITQLYVSVDAPTPESLEAIDRPLFNDAWDRLKLSLSCLKDKGQRTVARLTVVKGWNSDEIGGYARLIALGHCSLVEVKGVTFCGKSDASNLNMSNTPWHHEVVKFAKILMEELRAISEEGGDDPLPEYDLACEHKHSCSVLLARVDQFAVPDPEDPSKRKWRTWIDYDKFALLAARNAADPTFRFGVEDYIADTPSWACFGADEEGFDPTDMRHRKKNKHPKYAMFDDDGVPTHDTFNEPLADDEVAGLRSRMEERKKESGDATTVTELHGGEKIINDPSLMFRGLVVIR